MNNANSCFLSIITINKNNAAGLEKTIQSVADQTFTDFEYIVIDGASNDGSVEIIIKLADKINYWKSESDTGIYNAMNSGIKKAHGEFCLFLNSGDFLVESETLANVFEEISKLKESDIYYGDCIMSDNSIIKYQPEIQINHLITGTISHQNSLIKRSLFYEHGLYNENLKISSDWEFFLLEYYKYHSKFIHITTNIAIFDNNGISKKAMEQRRTEAFIVYKNTFSDMGEIFNEFYEYRYSIYYDIIRKWSNSKIVGFILKACRFTARRFCKETKFEFSGNNITLQ
jgi:glycosyltransferase involved in cell wall biosynthesis